MINLVFFLFILNVNESFFSLMYSEVGYNNSNSSAIKSLYQFNQIGLFVQSVNRDIPPCFDI